jgi:hypothetical protein
MNNEEARNLAESHWEYTGKVIALTKGIDIDDIESLELMKFLYVEAMIHGVKHERDFNKPVEKV